MMNKDINIAILEELKRIANEALKNKINIEPSTCTAT